MGFTVLASTTSQRFKSKWIRSSLKRSPGLSKTRTPLKRRLGKFCMGYISPWLIEFPFPGEFD